MNRPPPPRRCEGLTRLQNWFQYQAFAEMIYLTADLKFVVPHVDNRHVGHFEFNPFNLKERELLSAWLAQAVLPPMYC